MARRKTAGIALLILILAGTTYGVWTLLNPEGPSGPTGDVEIISHPYNDLNWWDLPWEIGEDGLFLDPILQITGDGNRHLENPNTGYYDAADYLISELNSWGIDTELFGDWDSVLGYQPGYANDSRAIVFGAHLDSDTGGIGVAQNAGGAAVVTMIAEILSEFRLPIDIYYTYFSYNTVFLDDQNTIRAMWGSKEISQYFADEGVDVVAFYNFDNLLFYDPLQPLEESLVAEHHHPGDRGYHSTIYPAALVQSFLSQAGFNILSLSEYTLTQTDHWSFWDQGFPAINFATGHTIDPEFPPTDAVYSQDYNRTHAVKLAEACAAAAIYLGLQGNGNQASFKLKTLLTPGESTTIKPTMSTSQLVDITGNANSSNGLQISATNADNEYILQATAISESSFSLQTTQNSGLGRTSFRIQNVGNASVEFELFLTYECDTDGNSVFDSAQYTWDPPSPALDWDKDELSDINEVIAGTDIFIPDTDMDSIKDGYEFDFGMDPLSDDTLEDLDGDGLTNLREHTLGLFPNSTDTDQDMMDDQWEVLYLTDPLVDDSMEDFDNDNLTNIEEYTYGADPWSIDGDFDGLLDYDEVQLGTNPLSSDTDGDGLRDRLELIEGLDPLVPDYDADLSPDGPDRNPRVNTIIVIVALAFLPVLIGAIYFKRRLNTI